MILHLTFSYFLLLNIENIIIEITNIVNINNIIIDIKLILE